MSTYTTAVLADSPVEAWFLDEASGTSAASSGSGNHTGTVAGGAAVVTGKDGNARSFDGTDDYISAASVADFTAQTNYSVEAWFKISSADTTGTDWRTITRRDGSGAWLVRVAGSTSGIQQGAVQVYFQGLLISTGSTRFDDNAWHQVVVTKASSTYKLYVDGTNYTTSSGSAGSAIGTTGAFIIGNAGGAGGSERFKGSIDAVSIYHTALSSGTITSHYNAANSVSGGYTAQAMTASTTNPDATVTAIKITESLTVTNDVQLTLSNGNATDSGNQTTLSTGFISGAWTALAMRSSAFSVPAGYTVTNAKIRFYVSSIPLAPTSVDLYRIDSTWTEASSSIASYTSIRTISQTFTTGWNEIDITDIAQDWATGGHTNYGVAIMANSLVINTQDSSNKPTFEKTMAADGPANVSASPMTASAAMPGGAVAIDDGYTAQATTASATLVDPAVSTTSGDTTNPAAVLAASATLVNPGVTADREAGVTAEPMTAAATWPTTNGFSLPATGTANAMTATATTVDATVATQRGPRIVAEPFAATANWKAPTSVNGQEIVASETEDKYFQRVFADNPSTWYRFNSKSSVEDDRMDLTDTLQGAYAGDVLYGRNDGPDGRHSVRFQGNGYFAQGEPNPDEMGSASGGAVEFSFRTAKATQFIMVSYDSIAGALSVIKQPPVEVWLKDGKINYRSYNFQNQVLGEITGFRNLADNQWHSVVIRSYSGGAAILEGANGIEIYIDGKFEIRRTFYQQASGQNNRPMPGFPDYIGGRPSTLPGLVMGALPGSQWFVGDMSEVEYYRYSLDEYNITRHYYDFMAWNPIEADPVEAFAFTPADHKGRGNQKRALYLWWQAGEEDAYMFGEAYNNQPNMNPMIGAKGTIGVIGDYAGFKVFGKGIVLETVGAAYRDPVYDTPSLIDLEYHVDLNDYDMIMFGDWPDEGAEFDQWRGYIYNFQGHYERLLSQLRDANDRGISLLVTQPRLAVDLGIIDRVEWVPTLQESRASANTDSLYDYGSAVKFPWNIAGNIGLAGDAPGANGTGVPMITDPAYLAQKAIWYGDTNKNDRFRVRALIEGLTDIPAYMIEDAVFITERGDWGDMLIAWKYLHRMNGLQIGDEWFYHGSNLGMTANYVSANLDVARAGRWFGTWATPPTNVKAGTVVTTFGTKHWLNQSEVDNPYKDYVTTIVLRPGDYLAGRRVGGKIFVNFSEQPNQLRGSVKVQILPGSPEDDGTATWPTNYPPDTAAQREWEYSQTRWSANSTTIGGTPVTIQYQLPDGTIVNSQSPGGDGLIATTYGDLFREAYYPHYSMVARGLIWLRDRPVVGAGDVFPSAQPMTATAAMPNPTVVAERDADYTAQPMRAVAQMPRVAEDESGDVEILTLAMEATATFTNYSKTVSAAPMTASAEFVESFDMVHTTGEQVVLTLHAVNSITLYLKEEE